MSLYFFISSPMMLFAPVIYLPTFNFCFNSPIGHYVHFGLPGFLFPVGVHYIFIFVLFSLSSIYKQLAKIVLASVLKCNIHLSAILICVLGPFLRAILIPIILLKHMFSNPRCKQLSLSPCLCSMYKQHLETLFFFFLLINSLICVFLEIDLDCQTFKKKNLTLMTLSQIQLLSFKHHVLK